MREKKQPQASLAIGKALVVGCVVGLSGCALLLDWDVTGAEDPTDPNVEADARSESSSSSSGAPSDPDASDPGVENPVTDSGTVGDVIEELPEVPDAAPPVCNGDPACDRVVFVTSDVFIGGQIGGPELADQKCQAVANKNPHPRVQGRVFLAWLANAGGNGPLTRLARGTGKYVRPSGIVIANSFTDLTDKSILAPINETQSGTTLSSGLVWTGTQADGDIAIGKLCGNNWGKTNEEGRRGDVTQTNEGWASGNNIPCTQAHHLYCFER